MKSVEWEAMNCTFRLRVRGVGESAFRGAAAACIAGVERLEGLLSRYRDGSDIARINVMDGGQCLQVSEECRECLLLALRANESTRGAFDVSGGEWFEAAKRGWVRSERASRGTLCLDPDRPRIECLEAGTVLDLGGIGKGYALDRCAILLAEAGISDALISAGSSSHLAMSAGAWSIGIGEAEARRVHLLQGRAFAVSGQSVQPGHVLDPRGGELRGAMRAWVCHPVAALADAFATALLVLDPSGVEPLVAAEPELEILALQGWDGAG